jgi:hypothetical protein
MTGWPKASESLGAIWRARMSGELPGTEGTMIRMVRPGKACANTAVHHTVKTTSRNFATVRAGNSDLLAAS